MATTPTLPAQATTTVPPESKLLNIARARDDYELKSRIAAALLIQATLASQWEDQNDASQRLSDFVTANPDTFVERVFNLMATDDKMTGKIKRNQAQIITSDISDADILALLDAKWQWMADYLLGRGLI